MSKKSGFLLARFKLLISFFNQPATSHKGYFWSLIGELTSIESPGELLESLNPKKKSNNCVFNAPFDGDESKKMTKFFEVNVVNTQRWL